jgi:hypothetical protein
MKLEADIELDFEQLGRRYRRIRRCRLETELRLNRRITSLASSVASSLASSNQDVDIDEFVTIRGVILFGLDHQL